MQEPEAYDAGGQGVGQEQAIAAVSQAFSVPWGAAQLFVLSHPAWAEEEPRMSRPAWRSARGSASDFKR